MQRKKKRIREIKVGAFILVSIIIMVGVVFLIGGEKRLFGGKIKYKIFFNSTGGLYPGDPVLLKGVEVGNVVKIGFPSDLKKKKILVEISVLKKISPRIREDTRARISAASLVYGKVVELTMGSLKEPVIPPGGTIKAEEATTYAAIMDSTTLMLEDIREVFSKINNGKGMIGLLLNNPMETQQILHNLSVSSQRLASILEKADRDTSPLGVLLSDSINFRKTLVDIKNTTAGLEEVTKNLKDKKSVIGKFINDKEYGETLTKDLHSAIHSLASIAAKIDTGKGTLGSLLNNRELYTGLQDVVLGVKKSSVAKWLIRNRRKAGEKERLKKASSIQ